MMSTENLLGEFKEAEHSTPRSLNSSIQVELEQHVSKNIASGLGISMVGAIFLVALAHTQSAAVFTWNLNWIWLAAVALASLTTWLWSVRSRREAKPSTSRTRALITTYLCRTLWCRRSNFYQPRLYRKFGLRSYHSDCPDLCLATDPCPSAYFASPLLKPGFCTIVHCAAQLSTPDKPGIFTPSRTHLFYS